MTDTTARQRVTAFLDAFEDPAHPYHGTINTLRSEGLQLTVADLREVLAEPFLPSTWTAPDGTVYDLTRPLLDRDGDEWQVAAGPWPTAHMVDGDCSPRHLPDLIEDYGPITQADHRTDEGA